MIRRIISAFIVCILNIRYGQEVIIDNLKSVLFLSAMQKLYHIVKTNGGLLKVETKEAEGPTYIMVRNNWPKK